MHHPPWFSTKSHPRKKMAPQTALPTLPRLSTWRTLRRIRGNQTLKAPCKKVSTSVKITFSRISSYMSTHLTLGLSNLHKRMTKIRRRCFQSSIGQVKTAAGMARNIQKTKVMRNWKTTIITTATIVATHRPTKAIPISIATWTLFSTLWTVVIWTKESNYNLISSHLTCRLVSHNRRFNKTNWAKCCTKTATASPEWLIKRLNGSLVSKITTSSSSRTTQILIWDSTSTSISSNQRTTNIPRVYHKVRRILTLFQIKLAKLIWTFLACK